MDTLTHAISGAVLGRAVQGTRLAPPAHAAAIGFLAAAFPDSDVVLQWLVDPLTFINLHRGLTHSLLMAPVWAVFIAATCALLFGTRGAQRVRWRAAWPLVVMALLLHIAADVITSYGTQIFAPLSGFKASYPATFIIDVWFTGLLLAGLVFSLLRRSPLPARIALVMLAGYVGLQAVLMEQARNFGAHHARSMGLDDATVTALAQPLSPFNWRVVIEHADEYHVTQVNLRRREPLPVDDEAGFLHRVAAEYRPVHLAKWHRVLRFGEAPQAQWVREAWQQPAFESFRRFARLPVLQEIEQAPTGRCAWFADLRFTAGPVDAPLRTPFRYGICREGDGPWQVFREGKEGPEPLTRR